MLPKKRLKIRLLIILFLFSIFIIYIIMTNIKDTTIVAQEKITDMISKAEYMQDNEILGGKTYYVSSNGTSAKGTDIDDPMSLQMANTKTFYGNDKILLKKGDIFYDQINFKVSASNDNFLYIVTYGNETLEKPIITTAYYIEDSEAFSKVGDNIYVLDMSKREHLKGYLTYYSTAYNVGFFRDENMNIYGDKKTTLEELEKDFDFFCDNKYLYIKSPQNPVELLGKITIASKFNIVNLKSNTILDGIIVQDTGAHGIIKEGNIENIYIKNCVIQNIGGSFLFDANGKLSRYGNGIEFWNQAENTIVEKCIFKNIYDAAYTLQGNSIKNGFSNNICRNNIIINSTYPIEISCHNGGSTENCDFAGNVVTENIIINQGKGFGYETRPNKNNASNMVIWRLPYVEDKLKYYDNKVYNSRSLYFEATTNIYKESIISDNNTYYLNENPVYFIDSKQHTDKSYLYGQGLDLNSAFNNISEEDANKISNEEILNSTNYEEIKAYYDDFDKKYITKNKVEKILESLKEIENKNKQIFENSEVSNTYNEVIEKLNALMDNIAIKQEDVINSYNEMYKLNSKIIDESFKGVFNNFTENNLDEICRLIDNISKDYQDIFSYYVVEDKIELQDVKDVLNNVIEKYNSNLDLNIEYLEEHINIAKDLYNNKIQTENIYKNVLNKQRILNISGLVDKVIDQKISVHIEKEKAEIKVRYDKDTNILTNEEIKVTLSVGKNTKIINNNGKNTYTFKQNGTFEFILEIRENTYKVPITITNINKEYNIDDEYISNIENGTSISEIKQKLSLKDFKVLRNGKVIGKENTKLATGDILKIENEEYTVVIKGDISCDGNVGLNEVVSYRKYLLEYINYNKLEEKAADVNMDSKLDTKDLVEIRKLILK